MALRYIEQEAAPQPMQNEPMQQQPIAPQASPASYTDYAKEIPRATAQGLAGFAGVPGEITQLAEAVRPAVGVSEGSLNQALAAGILEPDEYERAVKELRSLTPQQREEMQQRISKASRIPQLPTSEDITAAISPYIARPQTAIGKGAGNIAELTGRLLFPPSGEFL